MTDLILKSFNGVSQHKSYGGKTLQKNLENAEKAIAKVKYTEHIWDRSRSQWMLKFLTCSNADGWLRLRQVSAEMNGKRLALSGAKFSYMKKLTEAKIKREEMLKEKNKNKRLLLEIEASENESDAAEMLIKVEGALKEIETLGELHDALKERLGGNITEEQFEKAQVKSHIKRVVMQSVRDVRESGRIKAGNAEYLEQTGLSTSAIEKEVSAFIHQESESGIGDTSLLHKFLDVIANKYEGAAIQQADWLGFDPDANMNLTYEP